MVGWTRKGTFFPGSFCIALACGVPGRWTLDTTKRNTLGRTGHARARCGSGTSPKGLGWIGRWKVDCLLFGERADELSTHKSVSPAPE